MYVPVGMLMFNHCLGSAVMMDNVVCMKHPHYNKSNPPDLSCKVCCRQYVDNILARQQAMRENKNFNTYKWLEEKTKRNEVQPIV